MAKVTVVVDDLDGSAKAEPVEFAFRGAQFTIDLSRKNKAAFEAALRPYIDAGHRVSDRSARGSAERRRAGRGRAASKARVAKTADLSEIRKWAQANGYSVADRGRIPNAVTEAFAAAH